MGVEVKTPDCQYNSLLECPPEQRQCWRCGWNPKVMKERLQKFYAGAEQKEEEV